MDNNSMNQVPQYEQQMTYQTEKEEPMSLKEWLITLLIMLIPCVNIVMIFVWAFSKTEKKSKSNYFKAMLIVWVITIGLSILLAVFVGVTGTAAMLSL